MAKCINCQKESSLISSALELCVDCLRRDFKIVRSHIEEVHRQARSKFDLPTNPPNDPTGILCEICVNECKIPEGKKGYCGLRTNLGGRLVGITKESGNLSWYYDGLPTNCVADWVCPGGTGSGYPEFSHCPTPEYGYKNLAVFYNGCSFNCLFCQNWHYRRLIYRKERMTSAELAECVDDRTSCICYFGGDPIPQFPHAIATSRLALKNKSGRVLRICWETNGAMNSRFLGQMADLSLSSGGCIKFDLKAWSEGLHIALTGATNRRTLENFRILASRTKERPEPPFLIASTLLVPGYIDKNEIKGIAEFIASLDPAIPYSLLGFYPHFYMDDLPTTSKSQAYECLEVARKAGLENVRIGNIHLLRE